MRRIGNRVVGMLAGMPFVWASAGYIALATPDAADRPASQVVAEFMAHRNI